MRASEARLFTIPENVDAGLYLKDTEGRYLFANRAVRELWQIEDMADIVGFGDEKFFDESTSINIRGNDSRVLEIGETWVRTGETNTVASSGKIATYHSTLLLLRRSGRQHICSYAEFRLTSPLSGSMPGNPSNLAHYDALTTLPNRTLLADRLQ
ncbi:MAG: PAS domain-containing protein, partial [Propionivibrio sp.]|nr:PAS domain-containing protein [Propionivibrio sp.]